MTIAFQTGDGPGGAEAEALAFVGASATGDREHFSELCQKVIAAQACYDEGQNRHVILDVDRDALAYFATNRNEGVDGDHVRGVLWPGVCGAPSVFTFDDVPYCYRVHAIDESGTIAATSEACWTAADLPAPDDPGGPAPPPPPQSSGCGAAASAHGGMGALLAMLALTARRRRVDVVDQPRVR